MCFIATHRSPYDITSSVLCKNNVILSVFFLVTVTAYNGNISWEKKNPTKIVAGPIIVAYFAAWSIYGHFYFVSDIPGDRITHINYEFANIGWDGRIAIGDS